MTVSEKTCYPCVCLYPLFVLTQNMNLIIIMRVLPITAENKYIALFRAHLCISMVFMYIFEFKHYFLKFTCLTVSSSFTILSSVRYCILHKSPEYPGGQMHLKPVGMVLHIPPLWQGHLSSQLGP